MKILITGATSGIGYELAKLLLKEAEFLILTGRDQSALDTFPSPTITLAADLTQDRKPLLNLIYEHVPDLVINCAGSGLYGECLRHTTKEQLSIVNLNINAVVEITLEAARTLEKHQKAGTIVNISSAAAFFVYPSFAIYAASKAFINQFSQALDFELAPKNIRVLTPCPGMVKTSFRSRAAKNAPQKRGYAMSAKRAAKTILRQIKKKKPLMIFDCIFAFLTFIGRFCTPKSLRLRFCQKQIEKRIKF